MARPADLDGGEITDQGYVNQRQVLINRSTLVELLYAWPTHAHVIVSTCRKSQASKAAIQTLRRVWHSTGVRPAGRGRGGPATAPSARPDRAGG